MKHLKKFFEYYVIDPNFEAFENQVIQLSEKIFKENKTMTFEKLKKCVIECLGGEQEFKYGDDFAEKLAIIDKVCSMVVKNIDN